MTLGLALGGALLGRIGLINVGQALTYSGRLTGYFILAGAALVLVAASVAWYYFCVTQQVKYLGAVVLVGTLTILVAGLMLLAVQVQGRDVTPWIAAWLAMIVWSGLGLFLLFHDAGRQVLYGIKSSFKFAIGISLPTLVALLNFSYFEIYQPYATPELVTSHVQFDNPVPAPDGGKLVRVHFTLKNRGQVGLFVIQSNYLVVGQRTSFTSAPRGPKAWERDIDSGRFEFHRNVATINNVMIESGRITAPNATLEPGGMISEEKIAEVPRGTSYQDVAASMTIGLVRKDRVTLSREVIVESWKDPRSQLAPAWVTDGGAATVPYVRYEYRIGPSNAVLDFTRKQRYLVAWLVLNNTGPSLVQTVVASGEAYPEPSAADSELWFRRYGLIVSYSGAAEVPLGA